jgi:hypothetical protein
MPHTNYHSNLARRPAPLAIHKKLHLHRVWYYQSVHMVSKLPKTVVVCCVGALAYGVWIVCLPGAYSCK